MRGTSLGSGTEATRGEPIWGGSYGEWGWKVHTERLVVEEVLE